MLPVTEHFTKSDRHSSFYLACGPETGPLIIFVHGWPELGHSWRHQLRSLAALGFCCVAPDMRGYGRSSIYGAYRDYAVEHGVQDMLDLLVHLGRDRAIWVGHDWGSAVVWALASNHPDRCQAVASLCVPYIANGFAPANLIPLVNRKIYPESAYPAGQWEYWLFYQEHFDRARAAFEADVDNFVRALFRKGDPAGRGKPSFMAEVRRSNGWFGGADKAPSVPRDAGVITEQDLSIYVASFARTGFFGPDSWYMNDAANVAYAAAGKEQRHTHPPRPLPARHPTTIPAKRWTPASPNRCAATAPTLPRPSSPPAIGWPRSSPSRSTRRWQNGSPPKRPTLGRRQATGALANGANTSSTREAYRNRSCCGE